MRNTLLPTLLSLAVLAACSTSPSSGAFVDQDALVVDDAADGSGVSDAGGSGATDTTEEDARIEIDIQLDGDADAAADSTADDAIADATDTAADTAADTATDTAADTATDTAADTTADTAADTGTVAIPNPPTAPGPYTSDQTDTSYTVTYAAGERTMDVRIYLPSDLAAGPFPLVVLSHGFQLNGEGYNVLGDRLASHGFVVVSPSYGDNLFNALSHTALAQIVVATIDWAAAENGRSGSALFGHLDLDKIGVTGHSRGGKQSIYAAILDPRIKAVFGIDPVDSGPPVGGNDPVAFPSITPERMGELTVPFAAIGAGRGGETTFFGLGPACAPAADNYAAYFDAAGAPAFEYLVTDAGHLDFVDDCGFLCTTCGQGADASVGRNFAAQTAVAFFKVFLAADESYRPWVDGAPIAALAPAITIRQR
jgi:chlorophyllase